MSPLERKIVSRLAAWAPYLAAVNLILIIAVAAVAVVAAENSIRIDQAEHGACIRLKIQRTQQNQIALIAWTAFSQAAERERKLAGRAGPQQAIHAKNATETQAAASRLRWTPQTDCQRAVSDPGHYRAPTPQPFRRGQRSVP
jgi:hypothetical protein